MLDTATKKRIDDARQILVGKVPDPKSQVEQITIALIYKFMDDMDAESEEFGGKAASRWNHPDCFGWNNDRCLRQHRGRHLHKWSPHNGPQDRSDDQVSLDKLVIQQNQPLIPTHT